MEPKHQDYPSEKGGQDAGHAAAIPVPATAARVPLSTTRRLKRWLLVVFALGLWAVLFRARRQRYEAPPSWTMAVEAFERPGRGHHGHHGHHRILNGKRAEHIFL